MKYCKWRQIPENLSVPISLVDIPQSTLPLTLGLEVEHASDDDVVDGELAAVAAAVVGVVVDVDVVVV